MELIYVPINSVETIWPELRPFVERGLDNSMGEYWAEDLYWDLLGERAQLWVVMSEEGAKGAIVTQILSYPRKRSLRLVSCAGDSLDQWIDDANEQITGFARRKECDFIETYGRLGWVRRLQPIGFEYAYTAAVKEL